MSEGNIVFETVVTTINETVQNWESTPPVL
jgi:hypothetical protein